MGAVYVKEPPHLSPYHLLELNPQLFIYSYIGLVGFLVGFRKAAGHVPMVSFP